MTKIKSILGFAALLLLVSSCYQYDSVNYLDELDVTITTYNDSVDFTPYKTFAIRDSVVLVENHWKDWEVDRFYKENGASDSIISTIATKFKSIGYTQAADSTADVLINVVLMHIENTGTIWYPPGWWWGYWPYYGYSGVGASNYYYGWGWGGGYYPWYGVSYSYKTGTLDIEMADGNSIRKLNNVLSNYQEQGLSTKEINDMKNDLPQFELVWHAFIDGYVSNSKGYNEERAMRGLNEAIEQSPYLKR